ncbi:DNA-dependent metalloprotease WSS1, partial [Lecanoromycetidae sp. Uapishka_2]
MLHELCHIVHGPHDEHFHKLWDQLRDEYDALIRKGYTGEGFLSQGQKLGGGCIPMHEARRRARASAEKRQALNASSGQKLGGAPVRRGQDIRKVIADAAERRTRVTKGCSGSGLSKDRELELVRETNKNGFRTKAEEDDANEEAIMIAYIDLVQEEEKEKWGDAYIPPSWENPAGSQGGPAQIKSEPGTRPEASTSRNYGPKPPIPAATKPKPPPVIPAPLKPPPAQNDTWTCDICTLVNPSNYLCCDACGTEPPSPPPQPKQTPLTTPSTQYKPSSIRDSNAKKAVKSLMSLDATTSKLPQKPIGWLCHTCGNFMENEWWTCGQCGTMKLTS